MTNARILNINQLAVVGFKRIARIELGESVGPHDLPVGAARKDASFHAGTLERSTQDLDDPAPASGNRSDVERRAYLHANFEGKFELGRGHLEVLENSPNSPPRDEPFLPPSPSRTPKRSTTCVRLFPKGVLEGTGLPSMSAFCTDS